MGAIFNLNQRAKRFSIIDLKLVQGVAMLFALIIARFIPGILNIGIWWFIAALVICGIKPFCVFWFGKQER
jgi:hypothetical protein